MSLEVVEILEAATVCYLNRFTVYVPHVPTVQVGIGRSAVVRRHAGKCQVLPRTHRETDGRRWWPVRRSAALSCGSLQGQLFTETCLVSGQPPKPQLLVLPPPALPTALSRASADGVVITVGSRTGGGSERQLDVDPTVVGARTQGSPVCPGQRGRATPPSTS